MKKPITETLAKLIIPAVLAYAIFMIADATAKKTEGEELLRVLTEQADTLRRENESLRGELERGFSREVIASIARERFGLVFPDEKVFYDPSE